MQMSPGARKVVLSAHVLSSIGWFGALLVFLAHSVVSVVSGDLDLVRSVSIAMGLTAWFVILPLSVASLSTGLVQALGTAWGLVRHYWVIAKLLLTAFATAILLLKLPPISDLAAAAAQATFSPTTLFGLKQSLLLHSVGGLFVLLVTTLLAVYKPVGETHIGGRRHAASERSPLPSWVRIFLIVTGTVALALILLLMHGGHGPAVHSMHDP
jgi:hypothetical protein